MPSAPWRQIAADDPVRECHAMILAAWDKTFGSDAVCVTEIVKRALERDQVGGLVSPELHDALMAVAATKDGKLSNQRLGYWLRQHRDKVLSRRALRRSSTVHHDNVARWYLQTS
jgi:hypothetical protein